MQLPTLMPFQELPFNGDTFIQEEFQSLKEKFALIAAVETGTCLGSTAMWLSKEFPQLITIEHNAEFRKLAKQRATEAGVDSDFFYQGDSAKMLPEVITYHKLTDNTLFFLDAHWENACPLQDELKAIAEAKLRPVIAIHDFVVPDSKLGFDSYNGQPFTFEWLKPLFDNIYGENGYEHSYNSDEKSTEVKRGIIYLYPVTQDELIIESSDEIFGDAKYGVRTPADPLTTYLTTEQKQALEKSNGTEDLAPVAIYSGIPDADKAIQRETLTRFDVKSELQNIHNPRKINDPYQDQDTVKPSGVEDIAPKLIEQTTGFHKPNGYNADAIVPVLHLYVNFYRDKNEQRQTELEETLALNIANEDINAVTVWVHPDDLDYALGFAFSKTAAFGKIKWYVNTARPTYEMFFKLMRDNMKSDREIMILSNSDIYITTSVSALLKQHMKPLFCFALSHWDKLANGDYRHGNLAQDGITEVGKDDSQDVWVFKGYLREIPRCNFLMGKPGCDNFIAKCIQQAGYRIFNPSKDIRPVHHHLSNIRNYITIPVGSGINTDRIGTAEDYLMVPPINVKQLPLVPDDIIEPVKTWVELIPSAVDQSGHSQYGEDAIIQHIFAHISPWNRYYVDLGAGAYDGSKMSNTRALHNEGWAGYGIDANPSDDERLLQAFIKPETIVSEMNKLRTPKQFDFLNLDIDSSDFWVLQAILDAGYSPRLICTEFNGTLDPNVSKVLKYEEGYTWDNTNKYGYSFAAGKKLLEKHGYVVVHNMLNLNIFAVREDLMSGINPIVTAKQELYHPNNPNAEWIDY